MLRHTWALRRFLTVCVRAIHPLWSLAHWGHSTLIVRIHTLWRKLSHHGSRWTHVGIPATLLHVTRALLEHHWLKSTRTRPLLIPVHRHATIPTSTRVAHWCRHIRSWRSSPIHSTSLVLLFLLFFFWYRG